MSPKKAKLNSNTVLDINQTEEGFKICSKDIINQTNGTKTRESMKRKTSNPENDSNKSTINSLTNGVKNNHSTDPTLNYSPRLFLRSHCKQNDPFDNSTAIWSASFKPKTKSSDGNRYVATCGANMVCIIDCFNTLDSPGQTVIARYIDDNKDEELASLAWNWFEEHFESSETPVLAVGGKRDILLLSTDQLHCYERLTDAHSDQINALLFYQKDLLLSASYDKFIKLWKISHSNDGVVTQVLRIIETRNQFLSLCYSAKYKTIIGSGMQGIVFCQNITDNSVETEPILGQIKTQKLVDGLHIIPNDEDTVAIRLFNQKSEITLIDLKLVINEISRPDNNSHKIKPILLTNVRKSKLESFDSSFPFIYFTAVKNVLASGGPYGQIWLYNTDKFANIDKFNNKMIGKVDRIIEWPLIENIVKNGKKIIDDTKSPIVNAVTISSDLKILIACTNMNLICIWQLSNTQ